MNPLYSRNHFILQHFISYTGFFFCFFCLEFINYSEINLQFTNVFTCKCHIPTGLQRLCLLIHAARQSGWWSRISPADLGAFRIRMRCFTNLLHLRGLFEPSAASSHCEHKYQQFRHLSFNIKHHNCAEV